MASSNRSSKRARIEKKVENRVLIEDFTNGRELAPIPVINNFTHATPRNFNYVHGNAYSPVTTELADDTSITANGCSCLLECDANCECEKNSSIAFDPENRIVVDPFRYDFYRDFYVECGQHCKCKGKCKRQILPKNYALKKLEIHYIPGKQFGIVAAQPIAAGMPVIEYVGEVFVNGVEGSIYPPSHYQQDLLTDNQNNQFIIDAKRFGNISRFINHSCFNNVLQICVYPSIPDVKKCPPLPRVALVAFRDILPGQELTFNYCAMYFLSRGKPCLCYEPNCLVPPSDHAAKSRTPLDVDNELDKNKEKMKNLFPQALDLEFPVVEID